MQRDIRQEAKHKWPGICNSLGINVGNSGKHCPCPICGGKDRFRFDDKEGNGTWICNQCGAGDGVKLVMDILKLEFVEAVKEIRKIIGTCDISKPQPEPKISKELLRKIFKESKAMTADDPVGLYLRNRGISISTQKLRFHPKCYEPETHSDMPAMLATYMLPDNTAITMHRTYLTIDGKKADIQKPKKILPALQKMTGGAIRLFEPVDGMIGVAEGIETALAVTELTQIPCWSTVSSALMEGFEPPKGIKYVMIFSDNDLNYVGEKAAYTLANKIVVKYRLQTEVSVSKAGDFLDDLLNKRR